MIKYCPVLSLTEPSDVPSMKTFAPIIGSLFSVSVIMPLILPVVPPLIIPKQQR